jgi:hypothetical protein
MPRDIQFVDGSFPAKITVQVPPSSISFGCLEKTDLRNKRDITILTAYTIQSCIEACLLYNYFNATEPCKAVSFASDMSYVYAQYGANCWLKSVFSKGDQVYASQRTVVYIAIPA